LEFILPEEADVVAGTASGIGAAACWGTLLAAAESSRGIGVIFNFIGALFDFALIAYRLFWNQFQTYK
jgi:hypothetical protein